MLRIAISSSCLESPLCAAGWGVSVTGAASRVSSVAVLHCITLSQGHDAAVKLCSTYSTAQACIIEQRSCVALRLWGITPPIDESPPGRYQFLPWMIKAVGQAIPLSLFSFSTFKTSFFLAGSTVFFMSNEKCSYLFTAFRLHRSFSALQSLNSSM